MPAICLEHNGLLAEEVHQPIFWATIPILPIGLDRFTTRIPADPSRLVCRRNCTKGLQQTSSVALILLLLCSSGDVEVNPGPATPSSTHISQALSFVDFCNHKGLGFMHVNIRRILLKFVLFTLLALSAIPDILAMSESWLREATKNPNISIFKKCRSRNRYTPWFTPGWQSVLRQ